MTFSISKPSSLYILYVITLNKKFYNFKYTKKFIKKLSQNKCDV